MSEMGRPTLTCVVGVMCAIVAYNVIPSRRTQEKDGKPDWIHSCKGRMLENRDGLMAIFYKLKHLLENIGNNVIRTVEWTIGYDFQFVLGCPADDKTMGTMSKLVDRIGLEKLEAMVLEALKRQPNGIHKNVVQQ